MIYSGRNVSGKSYKPSSHLYISTTFIVWIFASHLIYCALFTSCGDPASDEIFIVTRNLWSRLLGRLFGGICVVRFARAVSFICGFCTFILELWMSIACVDPVLLQGTHENSQISSYSKIGNIYSLYLSKLLFIKLYPSKLLFFTI